MSITVGQVVQNRFRIVDLLGQGGFGSVYRAWDSVLERPCAIKESIDTSTEAQRQFKREASLLANLAHPNLPRVTDYFSITGQGQYLVMDFVEGEDLEKMVERTGGPLPEAQVLPWIAQICDALHYLHSQNPPIIHRDIKPANIKITPLGQAVLVDFGIAKVYDPKLSTTLGARAVTPGYSPPEQYGMGTTDASSDVYALGATLYTLLTGQTPPASVDVVAGSMPPPAPVRALNPAVSPGTSAVVDQAMRVNRMERFRSANAVKSALLQVTSPLGTVSPAGVSMTRAANAARQATPKSQPVSRRFSRGATIGGALMIVFVLALLFAGQALRLYMNNAPPTPTQELALAAASATASPEPTRPLPTATLLPPTPQPMPSPTPTTGPMMISLATPAEWPAWIVDDHDITMVYAPAGEFLMGKENTIVASPVHAVYLDAFYIDQYEVTNARYAECVAAGACKEPLYRSSLKRANYYGDPTYDDYPVIFVTWQMAVEYCDWRGGRLPTEAEWEHAARGGLQGKTYPWGDELPVCELGAANGARFDDDDGCNDADTLPVGSFIPNGYGLYDMAGNVWEWTSDWYAPDYYDASPVENPQGPAEGEYRVLRGGSFAGSRILQGVYFRNSYDPKRHSYTYGVRCVRPLDSLTIIAAVNTPAPAALPTIVPIPTATPGPPAEVIVQSVNVRFGPGTQYGVLKFAMRGEQLEVIGRSKDSFWLAVKIEGDLTGWVTTSSLSFAFRIADLPVIEAPPPPDRQAGGDGSSVTAAGSTDAGGGGRYTYWNWK